MRMVFPEFTRITKALGRMAGTPADLAPKYPGLANVLFAHPLSREGMWAFYGNGFEILGLKLALLEPFEGRRIYARTDLVAAQLAMSEAGARDEDQVSLEENKIVLHRAHPGRGQRSLEIAAPDGRFCSITTLPDPVGERKVFSAATVSALQRTTDLWEGGGGCLWLRDGVGAFAHARGVSRKTPCEIALPEPRLCFVLFAGFLGLDPSLPVECFLTTNPLLNGAVSRRVGFEQPGALYYPVQHSLEAVSQFDLPGREAALDQIARAPRPWLRVPRRTERRALIRALTDLGGSGVRLSSDEQGLVRASNGITDPVNLPMVKADGVGVINCRPGDLCRVLRQDFSRFELSGDGDPAAIIFDRADDGTLGAITVVGRP